jgi:hypothetical protein
VSILRSLVDWYLQSLEREGAGDMVETAGPLAGVDESVRRNWDYLTSKPSADLVGDVNAAEESGEHPFALSPQCRAHLKANIFSFGEASS